MHIKQLGANKKAKAIALFVAVQGHEYDRYHADGGGAGNFGGTDLSDITLPCGGKIPVVEKARYLGSMIHRNGKCNSDVDSRIEKAAAAFSRLRPLVFNNKAILIEAKVAAYLTIVMSILLYGSEMWALTAASRRKLRSFHNRCVRSMAGISMWHVRENRMTTAEVQKVIGIASVDTYMMRRRLRWIGHVSRMEWGRVPRKLLSSWVYQKRPIGRPCMRWAESIERDLANAKIPRTKWHILAKDKSKWRSKIRHIGKTKKTKKKN